MKTKKLLAIALCLCLGLSMLAIPAYAADNPCAVNRILQRFIPAPVVNRATWSPPATAHTSSTFSVDTKLSWSITTSDGWIEAYVYDPATYSPNTPVYDGRGKGYFKISVAANTSGKERTGTVTVRNFVGAATTVLVTQQGGVTVNRTSWQPSLKATTSSNFLITAKGSWSITTSASWIKTSVSKGSNSGKFKISVTATSGSRQGFVHVKGADGSLVTVIVKQQKPPPSN